MRAFKLGLIINPFAGIGGALALKGSDGKEIREKALAMGAQKKANAKSRLALQQIDQSAGEITIFTASAEMGEDVSVSLGFTTHVVYHPNDSQTEAVDSMQAAKALMAEKVDLILFAGGDGTARNIYDVVGDKIPVLGIPAGCKIHSGVYAITPKSAGRVVNMLVAGEIVSLNEAEVKDIDEQRFREGKVHAKYYGEMRVPTELRYVQAVKMGGKESQEMVLADIAAYVIEIMQEHPQTVFIMGSGSTVDAIMQELGLPNTLLGVDLVLDQQLLCQDATEQDILRHIADHEAKLVITLIGGQGHVFGRGNQQLSPEVITKVGRENIILVATKTKLQGLQGRPLISDCGDSQLDSSLAGLMSVITGYKDQVLYPLNSEEVN
ncbi:ATP-NAD kinase family protein [Aliiglaciecola litoralis]|uniref:ATP-NAD kinase family protein n=1 Tax=Aliiglaciecola litoralis TaxID=582857 RepID=A0ABP3X1M1_9ALTE